MSPALKNVLAGNHLLIMYLINHLVMELLFVQRFAVEFYLYIGAQIISQKFNKLRVRKMCSNKIKTFIKNQPENSIHPQRLNDYAIN